MKNYNNRNEIPEQYKWDLSSLYNDEQKWEEDFESVNQLIEKLSSLEGSVTQSADRLYECITLNLSISRKLSNLFTYAKMKQDEDTKNSKYQGLTSRAQNLMVKVDSASSFIYPEILSVPKEKILDFIDSSEDLKLYRQYIDNILRKKEHTLSPSEEKILAQAGEMAQAPQKIFGMLNAADLKFPTIKDEDGNDLKLTHGNFVPTLQSVNRDVRKKAFTNYYGIYKDHINTFAASLSAEVNKNIFYSKVKQHESARSAALFENNIPVSVNENLIDAVNNNLDAMHKYMSLRKKMLNVQELHMYDIYTPIVKDIDMKIPFDEAKNTTIDSLDILGRDYVSVVKSAFDDRWIDVYETQGKRSGAYSWGTYDSNPFIMLNYQDTLDNMFTLTHEMGHSMHSYLTRKNQPFVYGNYSIFLAEVASITNEALMNNHLLKTVEEKEKRLYILNHYLEQFRGTVYRQTMFAEFERDIHQMAEDGKALTVDVLCDHYKHLNEKYYGNEMIVDDEISLEWARIPHFYYNFYVFQYATGFSAAIALAQKMINEGEKAIDKYINFLSAGSTKYPIEILKDAGIDMTTKEPVDNALKLFSELVNEMEDLLK